LEAISAGFGEEYRVATAQTHRGMRLLLSRDRGATFTGKQLDEWQIAMCPMSTAALLSARASKVEWLTEADVAARLRDLRADPSAWRRTSDAGQFSLAGAQPKIAFMLDRGRWGVPSGRTPTTHILKPPSGELDGHAENEHLCLALARALGLPAARSEVRRFEDETAIMVERYDRVRASGAVRRVHQEDLCQALGVHPAKKYQNEGGPSPREMIELLRANVRGEPPDDAVNTFAVNETATPFMVTDMNTFLGALIFNWLIGGTDAHAKNYSLLIGAGGSVRLAPLYDLASILAYPQIDPRKAKLAMKVGDEYRLSNIGAAEWRKLAAEVRTDGDALVLRARAMASELPDRLNDEAGKLRKAGLKHRIVGNLTSTLTERARRLAGS
ncbi:MAG: HipA domain-containing protein, partial [Parvularculaceae bacterium]